MVLLAYRKQQAQKEDVHCDEAGGLHDPRSGTSTIGSVRQIPESFEEAAEVAGGSWPRTFAQILFPNMRPGVVAAWLVSFIFAVGELGTTILVAPPGESTLPVRIYTLIANTPSSEVAALALMEVGIILVPLTLLAFLTRGGVKQRGESGG
jgi:iron(III) transport system permease protein